MLITHYAFNRVGVSGDVFLWFLCTFRSCWVLLVCHLMFSPVYVIIYEFQIQEWRLDIHIAYLLHFFIWTPVDWLVAFNMIRSSLCLCWVLWTFVILEKWGSFWVIILQNLRIGITFAFWFKICPPVEVDQLLPNIRHIEVLFF